jgi:hypothetical protein
VPISLSPSYPLMMSTLPPKQPPIWWENIIFFCGTHLAAAYGVYHRPPATVPKAILIATLALWQLASFGCALPALYPNRRVIPYLTQHPDVVSLLDTTAYILIGLSMLHLAYGSSSQQSEQAPFRVQSRYFTYPSCLRETLLMSFLSVVVRKRP